MPTRVFVTGATGFVGAHLTRSLGHLGYALRCLLRPGSDAADLAGIDFERVDGTLDDADVLAEALRGVDQVVHLAGLVSFDKRDTAALFRVNEEGTRRLARLAREAGVGRFLHVSSVFAVGYSDRPVILDETARYNFDRLRIPYGDSKRAAEQAVLAEVARGLDAVIVNPASMFGPGDRRKTKGSILEKVAYRKLPFCPPGGANFVDVRDVISGCMSALEYGRTGERYILGGHNLTGRQLCARIAGVLETRPPRFAMPRPAALLLGRMATWWEALRPLRPPLTAQVLRVAPRYHWYSSEKAEDELGYAAYPIEIALKSALEWMLATGLLDPARIPPAEPAG